MPSSNKTKHLALNRWGGEDKPKMADFNADNQKIDDGISALQTALDSQAGAISAQGTTLASHAATIGSQAAALSSHASTINSQAGTINSHIDASDLHLTKTQIEQIAGGGTNFSMITYTGNNDMSRRIALGFKPRFGFLFAVGMPTIDMNSNLPGISVYSAFFSQEGSCENVTLDNNDIIVRNATHTSPDGNRIALNSSGVKYVVIAAP